MKAEPSTRFGAGEAAPGPDAAADPDARRVTVIITNHNYGHFLRDCIESVLNQTRAPDQLIIVDDGSQDGSAAILDAYADRAEILRCAAAGGQAAAFNAGARLATGDIVLFLDADDLLRPEAIEVVLAYHAPDFTLVFFGLETVDADGRSTGVHQYSLDGEDGDNRPRLLRSGSTGPGFSFAPTSANAFSRSFLDWVLPMPEAAWKICADAYLVRAAALHGRVKAIRQVLGAYRIHGGNNYTRADTFEAWGLQRGLRDLQVSFEALRGLADGPDLGVVASDPAALRLALRLRALEVAATIHAASGQPGTLRAALCHAVPATLRDALPLRDRLAAVASMTRFAGIAFGRRGRAGPALPHGRDRAPRSGRLNARLAALERPRWLATLPYGTMLHPAARGAGWSVLADGWFGEVVDRQRWSSADRAALEFLLEPTKGPVAIDLRVAVHDAWTPAGGLRFVVGAAGEQLAAAEISGEGRIRVTVDRDIWRPSQPLRLEIRVAPARRRRSLGLRRPPLRFALHHILAVEHEPKAAAAFLRPGATTALVHFLGGRSADGWTVHADGTASLADGEARLRISLPPGPEPLELALAFRRPVPEGRLRIRCNGRDIFLGDTGPADRIAVPLPFEQRPLSTEATLHVTYAPRDPSPTSALNLATIAVTPRPNWRDAHYPAACWDHGPSPLIPGQVVAAGGEAGRALLGDGWGTAGDTARTVAPEAALTLRLPEGIAQPALVLYLRPALPPVESHRHLLGVSANGSMLRVVELIGEGEVEIALSELARDPDGTLSLVLHSIHAPAEQAKAAAAPPAPMTAMAELLWISLRGTAPAQPPAAVAPPAYVRPHFLAQVDGLAAMLEAEHSLDGLLEARAALAEAIRRMDPRGLMPLFADPARAHAVERLGAAVQGVPLTPAERIAADAARAATASDDPRERARAFVLGMLLLPAFRLPGLADLARLPALLLRHPEPVADYLGRDPDFEAEAEVTDYVAYLEALLASIEDAFDRQAPDSAHYRLAVRVLTGLRNGRAIFGGDNLRRMFRLRGRCMEKLLVRAGAPLALPRRPRIGASRLRVGALVRHLGPSPETWAVLAMYRNLDRRRFDLTLITTDSADGEVPAAPVFGRTLALAGRPVEAAVAEIRALDLDVYVQNAYFTKWERVSAIAAHRLARVQVSACFNCPTTLGLASFDHALAWSGIAADDAQGQHSETLVTTEAPLQCCFDFSGIAQQHAPRDDMRAALGLLSDTVVLTSGAMAHKILPDLMAAWAEILARVPNARLVLYPFAQCWSTRYAVEPFRLRLARHLAAEGVSPDRALVLDEQPPERIRALLAAADLYLDSFPYTGATTVCEALSCGLPVVTRAGPMLREQTGAAWVRAYGLPELAAQDARQYIAAAVQLARDPEKRSAAAAQVARVLASGRAPHSDSVRFGAAFSDALWKICADSGLFPGLWARPPAPAGKPEAAPPAPQVDPSPARAVTPSGRGAARKRRTASTPDPVRTVVITLPRSGSTAFGNLIGNAEGAEMHGELFHETTIQYRSGGISDPEALSQRNADPIAFLERVVAGARAKGARLVGFKLFAFHNSQVLQSMIADRRTKIIYLNRSNTLARYSSRQIAEATGTWQVAPGEKPPEFRIPFDQEDFERFEATLNRLAGEVTGLLAEAGREVLFVEYKSMLEEQTIRRMSTFIGIDIPLGKDLRVARQNPVRTMDRFLDPDAVRRYLDTRGKASWAFGG